jgi:hypothetical protein
MQNITKNVVQNNMTGNRQIAIASTDEVKSITLTGAKTKRVTLKTGRAFGIIEADNIEFSCKQEDGVYNIEIFCRMVSTLGQHDTLFNRMKNKRWIVQIIDNNNIAWLAGTMEEPLRFRWEHIAEDKPSGQHCYELFFERQSTEPLYVAAVYYTIIIDEREHEVHYNDVSAEL